MPSKRFLEIQKLYTTLGFNSLSKSEVTYLLKRLEKAETILENLKRINFNVKDKEIDEVNQFIKGE